VIIVNILSFAIGYGRYDSNYDKNINNLNQEKSSLFSLKKLIFKWSFSVFYGIMSLVLYCIFNIYNFIIQMVKAVIFVILPSFMIIYALYIYHKNQTMLDFKAVIFINLINFNCIISIFYLHYHFINPEVNNNSTLPLKQKISNFITGLIYKLKNPNVIFALIITFSIFFYIRFFIASCTSYNNIFENINISIYILAGSYPLFSVIKTILILLTKKNSKYNV